MCSNTPTAFVITNGNNRVTYLTTSENSQFRGETFTVCGPIEYCSEDQGGLCDDCLVKYLREGKLLGSQMTMEFAFEQDERDEIVFHLQDGS